MPHPPLPIARRSWLRLRSTGAQQLQEVQVSIFLSKHRCVAPGVVCCAHVGTADVTLSLFSSHRGNGVHDPRPIPDLSAPRDQLGVAC